MKQLIIIVLFLNFIPLISAQTLQKDTAQANQYYQTVQRLEDKDSVKVDLLKKAIDLYDNHNFPKKTIVLKSALTYQYGLLKDAKALELGEATIQLAKKAFYKRRENFQLKANDSCILS